MYENQTIGILIIGLFSLVAAIGEERLGACIVSLLGSLLGRKKVVDGCQ
jgi:hypothetical protein